MPSSHKMNINYLAVCESVFVFILGQKGAGHTSCVYVHVHRVIQRVHVCVCMCVCRD